MTHKTLNTRHALESCTFQLHSWSPFHLQTLTKTLDPDPKPFRTKKPCLSDRATTPVDHLDFSKLTLFDDDRPPPPVQHLHKRESFRWIARKRRRRGSRSVSGRSSDRSGTRRCCSVGASGAYATCSDFPIAVGTDSSGELFVNGGGGDPNWASDVSDARNNPGRDGKDVGGAERDNSGGGYSQAGGSEAPGNESGYGSEPGYRGDAEFGYGDEFDEEEDDGRVLFWGNRLGDTDRMEIIGENTFLEQKSHHRCRRKKHDWRMFAPLRESGESEGAERGRAGDERGGERKMEESSQWLSVVASAPMLAGESGVETDGARK
ncbi:hypothetical protein MRB53_029091 [Persea americana]|uniref:Uncharacterized protein n=1 Tax=Persea americana TaxID=3435 RepID=A0ACC2KHC3_PERAE|nr:hypothetical protein MRB53_029091 [Persea americana]